MHIFVTKRELLRLFQHCKNVVDPKCTMPVLLNSLIECEDDSTIRVSATDMHTSLSGTTEATIEEPGSAAVDTRLFCDAVKAMPEGSLSVRTRVAGSTMELTSEDSRRRYEIPCISSDSFPMLPVPASDCNLLDLDVEVLERFIAQTLFSISEDLSRDVLCTALLEVKDECVCMVTADRHRLSKSSHMCRTLANMTMLIPRKTVLTLRGLAEEAMSASRGTNGGSVKIEHSGSHGFFTFDTIRLASTLVDGTFPPYQSVFGSARTGTVIIPQRKELMRAIKGVALVASKRSNGVKLKIRSDVMEIESESTESGRAYDEVAVDYDGEPVTLGVCAPYMLDVMGVMRCDSVSMLLGGEVDPIVMRPTDDTEAEEFTSILMPMRI